MNWRFLVGRLTHGLLLLVAVSALTFLMLDLAPGDFFDEERLNPQASPQTIQAHRVQSGITRSLSVRYWDWLCFVIRGDLGSSLAYRMPVADLVIPRCGNTLQLTVTALLLSWGAAVPLGVWVASGRWRWLDRLCSVGGTSLLAIPDLMLATIVLLIASRAGWLTLGTSVTLPAICLALGSFSILLRHVRAAVGGTLDSPFLRSGRGLGIRPVRLLFFHALPAAANPLISLLGLSVAGLFSSSLLVEVLFGWPGLGPLFLEAIGSRDTYVILAVVLLSATLLVVSHLLTDLLLFAADPRIRRKG